MVCVDLGFGLECVVVLVYVKVLEFGYFGGFTLARSFLGFGLVFDCVSCLFRT